jgi:hypothetical protein
MDFPFQVEAEEFHPLLLVKAKDFPRLYPARHDI